MSVIYIDGLAIRLVSDTHNKFNPIYAFGRSDCGVLALRDIQEDHLLLPCDAEGNVVVTPGRRYQIVTVAERRSATTADAFHAKLSPPPTTAERSPAQRQGAFDENKNDHSSTLPKSPQHTASNNIKGHNKSETAKAKGYPRVSTRGERSHEEHEEQKKGDRFEDNEKMKNGKEVSRSHKSTKDECNKNNNSTNYNELRGERTSPQVSSHGEDLPNGQKQQQHPKQKAKQRYDEDEKERKRPRASTSKTPSPTKNNNNKGDHVEAEESRERKVPHVELRSGPSGVTPPHHSSVKSPRSELTAAATTPPSIPSVAKHGVKHQPQVFSSSSSSSDDEEDEMPVVMWHAQRCAHSYQKQQEQQQQQQQQQRPQQNKKGEEEKEKAETGRTNVGPRIRTAKKVPMPLQGDTSSDSD